MENFDKDKVGWGRPIAAWPTSLEDYFQKVALLGQKAALNLWYVVTRPNSQNCSRALKVRHNCLIHFFIKLMFSYSFFFT